MSSSDQSAASLALAVSQECVCPTLDLIAGGDLAQRVPLDSLRQLTFACQPMPTVKPRLGLLTFILGVRHREHQTNVVYAYVY